MRPEQVVGIGTDFTACTMLPVLADGTPLCELPDLAGRPHAYVKLWNHHAAQAQADRIKALAEARKEPWLKRYGGKISSEWEFAKGLQLLEEDPELYARTERWVEAADWIVWRLCGNYVRNACTAGYKGQLPGRQLPLRRVPRRAQPRLRRVRDRQAGPPDRSARRSGRRADRRGGGMDRPSRRHRRVRRQRRRPCDRTRGDRGGAGPHGRHHGHLHLPRDELRPVGRSAGHVRCRRRRHPAGPVGIRGRAERRRRHLRLVRPTSFPASYAEEAAALGRDAHEHLTALAAEQEIGEHGLIALDWHSGNRSVLVDHDLSGVVVGQTLSTRPEDIYRALLEATAFGTRTIIETFENSGVPVEELIIAGGLTKNALLMQIYSDVTRLPLGVIDSAQGPALGAAMHAAVAAGAYADIRAAAQAMGKARPAVYLPDPERAAAYDRLYAEYRVLHDYFGRGANEVMHRLRRIRAEASALSGTAPRRPVDPLRKEPAWRTTPPTPIPSRRSGSSPAARACTATTSCSRWPTSPGASPRSLGSPGQDPGQDRVEAGPDRRRLDPPYVPGGDAPPTPASA